MKRAITILLLSVLPLFGGATLIWDKNDSRPDVFTEVWSCTALTANIWTLKASIFTNRLSISMTNQAEFFRVRNVFLLEGTNYLYSDWGTAK